jgi:hypothetical protein
VRVRAGFQQNRRAGGGRKSAPPASGARDRGYPSRQARVSSPTEAATGGFGGEGLPPSPQARVSSPTEAATGRSGGGWLPQPPSTRFRPGVRDLASIKAHALPSAHPAYSPG